MVCFGMSCTGFSVQLLSGILYLGNEISFLGNEISFLTGLQTRSRFWKRDETRSETRFETSAYFTCSCFSFPFRLILFF